VGTNLTDIVAQRRITIRELGGDLPCYMTIEEIKSLIRLPDLIACAKQNITTVEISAWKGTGLSEVLRWLEDTHRTNG
ncbi:hypothetical protein E2I00_012924, partial [Balaenoptera physalus]